jgi:hypothetical protein
VTQATVVVSHVLTQGLKCVVVLKGILVYAVEGLLLYHVVIHHLLNVEVFVQMLFFHIAELMTTTTLVHVTPR